MIKFIGKRLALLVPQMFLICLVSFLLTRLTPGNQARAQLGSSATEEAVAQLERELGLNDPWYAQFGRYLDGIAHGDLGTSWTTGQPVLDDIAQRAPATLELISVAFVIMMALALTLGLVGGLTRNALTRVGDKISYFYSLMAGAVPDFWFGMIVVFLFYYTFPIAVAPIGQYDQAFDPAVITGSVLVDSLVTLDLPVLFSHLDHLILPVLTLVFINTAPILRMVRSSVDDSLKSGYTTLAKANGLPQRQIVGYALRSALPPIITLAGVWYTVLIAGAVLTEQIFSWGGVGQYAVQAVQNADWSALQGVVLLAALLSLLVYLVIDLLHAWIDPRVRVTGGTR
ncbi:ABC transporter permease [Actinocorallia aurantiaca]|uniref:ABC transporter permease n=1 Tax=Actinocorallia aurantiaca TaxID=46204 RepID=A0ABP6GQ08_9ACTN